MIGMGEIESLEFKTFLTKDRLMRYSPNHDNITENIKFQQPDTKKINLLSEYY